MDPTMRVLLLAIGVAMLMLAAGRQRPSPVRSLRPIPYDLAETSRSRRESDMDQALTSPQITRKGLSGLGALIGAIVSIVGEEQALALRAADQAALHRRKLAELRAMYVRPLDQ
jgi:hypothetical protein